MSDTERVCEEEKYRFNIILVPWNHYIAIASHANREDNRSIVETTVPIPNALLCGSMCIVM